VYNGWLVHSHTNSYLYWEQCMGGLIVSLRLFIAMQELPSLNLMNCTCYVVTSPSILCALWEPDLLTLCWTMNSLSHISSYFLVRLNGNRHGDWIEMICHTMSRYDPSNMELPQWLYQPLLFLYPVHPNFITRLVSLCREITLFLLEFFTYWWFQCRH